MSLNFDAFDHEYFMREALKEAEIAIQELERPIGAVIVHYGRIIAKGRAQHRARNSDLAHAEMNALLKAEHYLKEHKYDDDRCIIYTTVEPCVMCLGAIVMSNITNIVFGLSDNWIKSSQLLKTEYIRKHIQHYVGGVLREESLELWEKTGLQELRLLLEGKR